MKQIITNIIHRVQGKIPKGSKRSREWPKVRSEVLKCHPNCAVCNGVKKLEVHHIVPFHLDKTKELDILNLIVLCEAKDKGINCHLAFGHFGSYKSHNENVREDAKTWNNKLKNRP